MNARRLTLTTVVSLCVTVCALISGTGSAGAATQFGSYGTGAGQFQLPWGVAVDQTSGDVYVTDAYHNRVDKFDGSGMFLMAWGWGVLNGASELQTCTTSCQEGLEGKGPGQLAGLLSVAVDQTSGDVYVGSDDSVVKFDASGKFLSFFGEEGTGNGQFHGYTDVAVGPAGRVYVGDQGRVQVFEPSGAWKETISFTGLSGSENIGSLAIDASGDMFVRFGQSVFDGIPGVHEYGPNGVEKAEFDTGSTTVAALALDGSGDLFVGDSGGGFHVLEYSSDGNLLASFGQSTAQFALGMGLAPTPDAPLYVTHENKEPLEVYVSISPTPKPGPPAIEAGSVSAVPARRGDATVNATIDAEGVASAYRLEYVSEADFQASGYADASSTPEVSLGSKFEEVPVSIALSELVPGGSYHYRVIATNADGTDTGPDQAFTTIPPALVTGPWVADVTSTSVTFAAQINPLGSSTDYHLEYGTSTAYGQILSGNVGEGESDVLVSYHREDLTPGTLYHYRVVVHNEVGVYESADYTFTTEAVGGQEISLPDGRAWELVSPPDKKGALLGVIPIHGSGVQAASDGSGITYRSSEAIGEDAVGSLGGAQVLSQRDASGWRSQNISVHEALPPEGTSADNLFSAEEYFYLFSTDLSQAFVEAPGAPPLSAGTMEEPPYLRDNANGTYLPLETSSNVQPGTKFGDPARRFFAATPDLKHVIFGTVLALTPEAAVVPPGVRPAETTQNLYEWNGGQLQLVNIRPDGQTEPGATLGSLEGFGGEGMTARAVSSDGRWVVWRYGALDQPGLELGKDPGYSDTLYVRDMVEKRTFQVGGSHARFEAMSSDGSKIFFVEDEENQGSGPGLRSGDLYVFDTSTDTQVNLTANHPAGERSAGVQPNLMGTSEDGSYVYFVATGVLASGAVSGADNLYVMHEAGGAWTTRYIATLSSEDSNSWRGLPEEGGGGAKALYRQSSRVSPDGRYVAFMSNRSLTGYDNLDAVTAQPDEEVYLFDAVKGSLVCASCDPTGARPIGVLDNRTKEEPLLVDAEALWSFDNGQGGSSNHWLAGSLPGWVNVFDIASYQPRYLSDGGRLFFDSPDALVPQDTNGFEDVYEYEPAGVGDCTSTGPTFGERSQGCVSLISSGLSTGESVFMDASESGDDAFFITGSKLTAEDYDTSYDMYDAHVCSTASPCRATAVAPPPCTSGDSCKAAPSPQPEIFGPAPSATFSGTGNVVEEATKTVVKRKTKSKKHVKKRTKRSKQAKRKAKRARKARSGRAGEKGGR